MLLGITLVILFISLFIGILLYDIKMERKEAKEPLSEELKNHYFIKEIQNISNELKKTKGEDEVKLFLQKSFKKEKSITEATNYSEMKSAETIAMAALGVTGLILSASTHQKSIKIERIENITFLWVYYLIDQLSNTVKKEQPKIIEDINKKINELLSEKILLLTKQKDIKDAWEVILKDTALTRKVLNQLWGEVKRILDLNK